MSELQDEKLQTFAVIWPKPVSLFDDDPNIISSDEYIFLFDLKVPLGTTIGEVLEILQKREDHRLTSEKKVRRITFMANIHTDQSIHLTPERFLQGTVGFEMIQPDEIRPAFITPGPNRGSRPNDELTDEVRDGDIIALLRVDIPMSERLKFLGLYPSMKEQFLRLSGNWKPR